MKRNLLAALMATIWSMPLAAADLNIELGTDIQYFSHTADSASIDYSTNSNTYFRVEYDRDFADGRVKFMLDTKAQYNQRDDRRRRMDFSELALGYFADEIDISAGVLTEFWGVTEARHLVDIINQTNVAENIDEEEKLGQPMVKLRLHQQWGSVQFFWLPVFRERIYPGDNARLGPGDSIHYKDALYESPREERHQDFALRYSHTLGEWDIGVAHFTGTSREPLLMLDTTQLPRISFVPYYELIDQTSIDVQMTSESLLLKLEAISRNSDAQGRYSAAVAGFEYTRVGIFNSAMDIGYIAEYLYDERDEQASTPFADDIFAGLRLVANDVAQTTLLLGAYVDRDNHSTAWRFEMDTRLRDGVTLNIEGQVFSNPRIEDLLYGFRNDDYLKVGVQWFF